MRQCSCSSFPAPVSRYQCLGISVRHQCPGAAGSDAYVASVSLERTRLVPAGMVMGESDIQMRCEPV